MTVSSATNEATFPGNGVATVFPLPFRFFANSDIIAQLIDSDTGSVADMTLGVDYTLAGAGDPEVNGSATGALTTVAPVPTGFSVFVRREIPLTQPTDIVNQGRFYPEIHETVFDRLTMQVQQQTTQASKALRVIPSEPQPAYLPLILQRAGKFLSFDENGNPVASAPVADSSTALRQDLLNILNDPALGANLIGYMGQTVAARFAKIRYVTDFANVQAAINSDASLLMWPAGENVVTSVTPRSFQIWMGVHRDASIMRWAPVNVPTFGYSMIQSSGDIQNFHIRNMTFVGNRPYQTSQSVDNQDMGCLHLRGGSVVNVSVEDCVIRDFGMLNLKGDNTTSGHGALIGSRAGTGKKIRNVRFERVEFRDISNVPGVYVNGESTFHDEMANIAVLDCDFIVDITTSIQNCIYILGDSTVVGRDIRTNGNRFAISKPIDCGIEINGATDFWVDENDFYVTGTGTCTPVLIRDGTASGSICDNRMRSTSTGTGNAAAVSIVAFGVASLTQQYLNVMRNQIFGWGTGSSGCAFNINAGSADVNLAYNFVAGLDGVLIDTGFILGNGVVRIRMDRNSLSFVKYPLRYAGEAIGCSFIENIMQNCGDGVSSLIVSNTSGYAVLDNRIERNQVITQTAGTANFVGIVSTASTGNRVCRNLLPSNMAAVNPSYLTAQATIETTPAGSGKTVLGNQYQFAQGAMTIANGSSLILGANLDAQGPTCKPGDFVIFTYVGDALGATIGSGYAPSTSGVRCRVSNNTGASITIPAGNWNVLIIPS